MMRKIIIMFLVVGFMFGQITKIETDYGDSTVVNAFHKNGSLKFEGTKIKRFKHGKWYHYDEKGFLVKIEKYHHGRKVQ